MQRSERKYPITLIIIQTMYKLKVVLPMFTVFNQILPILSSLYHFSPNFTSFYHFYYFLLLITTFYQLLPTSQQYFLTSHQFCDTNPSSQNSCRWELSLFLITHIINITAFSKSFTALTCIN